MEPVLRIRTRVQKGHRIELHIGSVYKAQGDLERALDYSQQALAINKRLPSVGRRPAVQAR